MVKARANSINAARPPVSATPQVMPQAVAPQPIVVDVQKVERRSDARKRARSIVDLALDEDGQLHTVDERLHFWKIIAETATERLAAAGHRAEPAIDPAAEKTMHIQPPDRKQASSQPITQGDAVSEALDLADECLSMIDDLPDRDEAITFGESVGEKVRAIAETVEDRQHVTANQMAALENMRDGLSRWIR